MALRDGAPLREVIATLDARYPRAWAEPWDAVGPVCGDPEQHVSRVLVAVDPHPDVVDEARTVGADLIVTHHPLLLSGVHGVDAGTPKGRLLHDLIRSGIALFAAHTNADRAAPGVSDALADALGLNVTGVLEPAARATDDKLAVFVPQGDVARVLDAMEAAGAGTIGAYERCAWSVAGTGTFRPGAEARPAIGTPGAIEQVDEVRLEIVCPPARRDAVLAALRSSHPYEEPAFDLYARIAPTDGTGLGRVGELDRPEPLSTFVERVGAALPVGAAGVRAAGDPSTLVHRVAVCGGAGDSAISAAIAAGVDVYVTGDLRHHRAQDALADGLPAIVDATHFGTEWPWVPQAARLLRDDLESRGASVEVHASTIVTDPWSIHGEGSLR